MTVLASISAENFCQFESFELKLARMGLVWLGGVNNDSSGADSNGSGKSNCIKAIGWCLYGETVENDPADDVIREGAKSTRVTIKTECGWEFARERKKGSPKLTVSHLGKPLVGSKADLQRKIVEVVGYDWPSFLNAVFYAQRDTKRFIHPRTTDAERKNIIHHIQGTEAVNDAHDWIKKEASSLRRELDAQESEKTNAASVLGALLLSGLKRKEALWEEERKSRIQSLKKKAAGLLDRARSETEKEKNRQAERKLLLKQRDLLTKRVSDIRLDKEKFKELDRDFSSARDELVSAKSDYVHDKKFCEKEERDLALFIAEGYCPVCESPTDAKHCAEYIRRNKANIAQLKRDLDASLENIESLELKLAVKKKRLDGLRSKIESSTSESELARIEGLLSVRSRSLASELIASVKGVKSEIERYRTETNPYVEEIRLSEKKKNEAEKRMALADKRIAEISKELAHFEFWKRGFSPTGLPSYMLDEAMPLLTERANKYLDTLSDGDIAINFSTQRELSSSGETRDEIGISWEIEGVAQKAPSGGQWRKMEIATDLAFIDLAAAGDAPSLDLLCLDEVLDGLDSTGRQRLTTLLHKMRSIRGTIIVVSHDSDISEIFERSITVIKEDGVARLEVR